MFSDQRRILIMTAVLEEKEAILRGLKQNPKIDVMLAGVGPVSAAAHTAKLLATEKYELVISTGIGGGFRGKAEIGTLVVSNLIAAADLGVETLEGFRRLEDLGFGTTQVQIELSLAARVVEALQSAKLDVVTGPIITAATATGTAESAEERARRVLGAAAEGMEGYGVAFAAQIFDIPVLEIRAISNGVGPRDRSAWRIHEAFDVLEKAYSILGEIL